MYDITIIGAGVSAVFFSYTLSQRMPKLKILLLEKGNMFDKRICPMESKKTDKCINCTVCGRFSGFGGLGKSEGKFNFTTDFGGDLHEKIGTDATQSSMKTVDEILRTFGGDKSPMYSTKNKTLENKLRESDFKSLNAEVRHLGLSLSCEILQKMETELLSKIEIRSGVKVIDIEENSGEFDVRLSNTASVKTKKVVVATGQSGKGFVPELCAKLGILYQETRLDLGIRVEMPKNYLTNTLSESFEAKLQYQKDGFTATTYCMNPEGRIVKKYQYGMIMADGQNYLEGTPTNSLNFSVFTPFYFSKPKDAQDYAQAVISKINKDRERIVCQRYADFLQKKPTAANDLAENGITPTIECEPGNLWDEVPNRCIEGALKILEIMSQLEQKGTPPDTLLYGLDAKFYEPKIATDIKFQSNIPNLYFIGDCSGVTYSLSQAAASGVYLASCMSDKAVL